MLRFLYLLLGLLLAAPVAASAYSVLTHQAIVDSTWDDALRPLLARRYPGATEAEWEETKSYAYGGAILQDMGYYPLGSEFFTNLTHYVRAGDFVRNLLAQARNRNEYAFALGALSHYVADNTGHPEGTNRIMPTVYPDLKTEFGPVVTYEQAPVRHTELEFSFDVVQVANGRYRTQEYHKLIGFRVSKPVLERAFLQTYGLELGQITANVDLSVATFRFTVNQLIPTAARAAWHNQRKEIRRISPRARRRDYIYHTNQRRFEQEYGRDYERPGFGARLLSGVLKVLPKIGPLKPYAFTLPSAEGEAQFRRSYRASLAGFRALVRQQHADTAALTPALPDTNLDTGQPTRFTTYDLADETHAQWARELYKHKFEHLTPAVRQHLLVFFGQKPLPDTVVGRSEANRDKDEKDKKEDEETRQETIEALKALHAQQP